MKLVLIPAGTFQMGSSMTAQPALSERDICRRSRDSAQSHAHKAVLYRGSRSNSRPISNVCGS
jgi:hypothetical protein